MRKRRWVIGAIVVAALGVLLWEAPDPSRVAEGTGALGPQVARPWQAGHPELGVQVYWVDDPADDLDVVRAKSRRILDMVVALEANSVALSFPFYAEAIDADTVSADARTPSPERVAVFLQVARELGLRTTLRPLLDETLLLAQDPRDWRGLLDPVDRDGWFASYLAFLSPYLDVAQLNQVATFTVAVELNTLQDDPRWTDLIAAARERFTGQLSYSANWDAYAEATRGIPTDAIGIDAYPQLDLLPTADVEEMTLAWSRWLDDTLLPGTPVVLSEIGAAAEARTLRNPAVPHTEGEPLDTAIQARWFTAACRAARERDLDGLYWWKIPFETDPAAVDPVLDLHDSFLGRPAEEAARACFAEWGAG